TGTGGTGNLQYSLHGTTFQASNTFANLVAGTYTFTVKDENNCIKTFPINLTEPALLTLSGANTPILCHGDLSTVTLTSTGGTGNLQYSLDGTTFLANNTFANLTAGNYTFTVKDENNCIKTFPINIIEPTLLTLTGANTPILCHGETSTVTLTGTGGTENLQYSLDGTTFQASNTFANLVAGNYTFTVKDENNCIKTFPINITEPALLTLSGANTPILCNGETSTVTLTANGGTGNLQFSLDGTTFLANNTFANLTAGNYTFTVKDENNCIKTFPINITEPALLTLSTNNTAIKCKGETSTVTLTSTGGTANYQYSKDGTTFQSNNTFANLTAGDYTFTVKDANDCITTKTLTIAEPDKITLATSNTAIKCFGETSTVTLTSTGGTGIYQYSKDGVNFQIGNTFTNLPAGVYTFTVKDANDCFMSKTLTITEPTQLTLATNNTAIKCKGETSTVSLTSKGGTGIYQYSKDGVNFQIGNTFTNLPAGVYTFTVKDANDCITTKTLTITEPSQPLSITETHQNNICYTDNKGQIKISVSGGVLPYTYNWSNGATTKDLSNLPAGIYTLVVTDKNNCSTSIQVEILPSKLFSIQEEIQQIKCFEENIGSISLQLSGGQTPYTVKWNNGLIGNSITNLTAGNYTYTATDAYGCSIVKTITITQPQKLTAQLTIKNTTCKYSPDGAIFTKVTGGTAPYRFIWNNTDRGANSSLINISLGKYTVTVIDANNCSVQLFGEVLPGNCAPSADNDNYRTREDTPIIINTPGVIINDIDPDDDDLKISLSSAKDPEGQAGTVNGTKSFFRTKNGTVTLNDNGSFTYTPNKNFFGTEYFIYEVTDGKLSSNFAQVTIVVEEVNDPPIAQNDNFNTLEDAPVNGSVAPNDNDPENQVLNYTLVDQPLNGTLTFNTDGTFNYIPLKDFNGTVTFTYQVCDPRGLCDQAVATIIISPVNDSPIALDDKFSLQRGASINQKVTENDVDPDGDILLFTALTQPQNGTLIFNTNGTFTYQPNPTFKGIDTFNYRACDPSGLCDNAMVTLVVQPQVTVNLIPKEALIREGDTIHVTAVLTESLVEDITVFIAINGTATLNKDYKLSQNFTSITIPANQTKSTQYFVVQALLDDIKDNGETVVSNVSSTTQPNFVLIGTGSTIAITDVYPETKPIAPTENPDINPDPMFSPNGDGNGNETFVIYNISKYPDNEVVIFNRWGNEVYRTKGYDNTGNSFRGVANVGILTNSNKDLVDGVYYYLIFTTQNGEKKTNKGYIILKR
ncbi:Ig-like domain-containing protein, partial [Pedobacter alpinus]|uniref:Ig-like domain-containing protein n=1 Tax=Pedobacter alpinus TaxID=1590643 RepID=UPI0036133E43